MNSGKLLFLASLSISLLSGCLSDEEKERIETAEKNVEKIALAPKITRPAENESISGLVDVYVDVDSNALEDYESVTLFIEGLPEIVDLEYPYQFTFNSYFWSANESLTLLAKVETKDGNQIRSDVVSVPVSSAAIEAVGVVSPSENAVFRSVDQVDIAWKSVPGARSYDYEVNGQINSSTGTSAAISVDTLGKHQIRVRATDESGHTGEWSELSYFSLLAPETPEIVSPNSGSRFQNVNSVNISWTGSDAIEFYEFVLDGNALERVDTNLISANELAVGQHWFKVRSIDVLGNKSEWSSSISFHVIPPAAPSIATAEVIDNENNFKLEVSLESGGSVNTVQVSTDSAFSPESIVDMLTSATNSLSTELVAGRYYIRAKAMNVLGQDSQWSNSQTVNVGLFSMAVNLSPRWMEDDNPLSAHLDGEDVIIVSNSGPFDDASMDSYSYVTKVDFSGQKKWGKSLGGVVSSISSARKSQNGLILSGKGPDWQDSVVMKVDFNGETSWKKGQESVTSEVDGSETYTRENIYDAVELNNNELVLLESSYQFKKTGEWTSELLTKRESISFYDSSTDFSERSSFVFPQSDTGEYKYINELLVSDESIYAIGSYKAAGNSDSSDDNFVPTQGSSGVVLFKVDKSGDISARIASGLSDRYSGDAALLSNGDIAVSYNRYNVAAASIFHSSQQSTDYITASGMEYESIVAGNDGELYMAGSAISDYASSFLVKFYNGTEVNRLNFNGFSRELSVKSLIYDKKYGLVVIGTDKGNLYGAEYNDRYTVVFNVIDSSLFLTPTVLRTDIGL